MSFFTPFTDSGIVPGKGSILPGLHPLPGRIIVLAVRVYKVWNFCMYAVTVSTVETPEIKRQLAPGFIFDVTAFAVFYFDLQITRRAANGMVTIPYLQVEDFQRVNTYVLDCSAQADFFTCLFFTMM